MDLHSILKKYWGYNEFRPLQEDVIRQVIGGKDTLALLPTGGGKSIIYQVSALALSGLCVVVTPLIALMKDQVEGLDSKGIPSVAIYTGLTSAQIKSNLNRISGGTVKFLFVSPERLQSQNFRDRLKTMNISLITVDEAHCISQWGYDFRPSYLKIAEIRSFFPDVPILALTATATKQVIQDIQDQLGFRSHNVLSKSFRRPNISYVCRETEDKLGEMLHILSKVPGSSIVYVRTRQKTREIADLLNTKGYTADYYHAGLSSIQRDRKQRLWKIGEIPTIVATNAFGMGIDKPDVRVVIHLDIPDALEAYFQEAGRAGRDEKRAFAVLLYSKATLKAIRERAEHAFPSKKLIGQFYQQLCDFFQLGEGEGEDSIFEFNIDNFVKVFRISYATTLAAIDILQVGGYLECTTAINAQSRLRFIVTREQLSELSFKSSIHEEILERILRTYAGVFTQMIYCDEQKLADDLGIEHEVLYESLLEFSRRRIMYYVPGNDRPYIIFRRPRIPMSYFSIPFEAYELRKKSFEEKIKGTEKYLLTTECRQINLVEYFGQCEDEPCGICDNCLKDKSTVKPRVKSAELRDTILELIKSKDLDIREWSKQLPKEEKDVSIQILRELLDDGIIYYSSPTIITLKRENALK